MPSAKELLVELINEDIGFIPADGTGPESLYFLSPKSPIDTIHEPLQLHASEIRLLSIHPSSSENDKIECSLATLLLHDNLKFTALSYVWGNPDITESITVNGKQMNVTTNLASALRHIRATGIREILDSIWIDAICINQQNILERNHQVQIMGSIYRAATLVLSWLGPDADNSTLAMNLVHRLGKAHQYAQSEGDSSLSWFEDFPEIWSNPLDVFVDPNHVFSAVTNLSRRPLFSRGWIFQESFLAKSQVFMCGHEAVTAQQLHQFKAFFTDLESLYSKPHFIDGISWTFLGSGICQWEFDSAQWWKRYFSQQGIRPTLCVLLMATAHLQVSEPQDKIFSLLGMIDDKIDVDYGRPLADLFSQVSQIWLREMGTLGFLEWASFKDMERVHLTIPSWAPDWYTKKVKIYLGYNGHCSASADIGPYAEILMDTRVLRCKGILLDVGRISKPVILKGYDFIFSTFKNYILKESWQYPTGIARLQALFQTFMSNSPGIRGLKEFDMDQELFCCAGAAFLKEICTASGQDLSNGLDSLGFSSHTQFEVSFQNRFLGMDSTIRAPGWLSIHEAGLNDHDHQAILVSAISLSSWELYFFHTGNGYLGFSTCDIEPDDIICVLLGKRTLSVLRKLDSSYLFVGSCWILGFMNGEALKLVSEGQIGLQVFDIK